MKKAGAGGTPCKGRAQEILDELNALEGSMLKTPSALKRRTSFSRASSPSSAVKHSQATTPQKSFRNADSPVDSPVSTKLVSRRRSSNESTPGVSVPGTPSSLETTYGGLQNNFKSVRTAEALSAERHRATKVPETPKEGGTSDQVKSERWPEPKSFDQAVSFKSDSAVAQPEQSVNTQQVAFKDDPSGQAAELANEILRLQSELAEARAQTKSFRETVATLQKSVVKSEGNEGHSQQQAVIAKQGVEAARKEADLARKEADEARQEADEARKEVEVARKGVDVARKEADEVRKEADVARKEADEAKREAEVLRGSLQELQNLVAALKEDGRNRESGVRGETEGLHAELAAERHRREAVCQELKKLKKDVDQLHQEATIAAEELRRNRSRTQSHESTASQLAAAEAANAALEQEVRRSQQRRSEWAHQERSLEDRVEALEAENAGLSGVNAKLVGKVRSLKAKVEALRGGVSPGVEEHADYEARLLKLQVRKQALKARVRALECQLSEAEDECREARTKYISLGVKVEELLQEESLTQELVLRERDQGRATLEEQLQNAKAAVQELTDRNSVLERGLAASEEEVFRQSRRTDHVTSQLQQSLVRLTQLERYEGSGTATEREGGMSYAELIEVQANEVRKSAEESASAQQKASVLESGILQLRSLCEELQRELVRSAREAGFWRNTAEEAVWKTEEARAEATEAIGKTLTLERLLEAQELEARLLESKINVLCTAFPRQLEASLRVESSDVRMGEHDVKANSAKGVPA